MRYAGTSAPGRATIQITNYYYAASEQAAGGRGSVAGAGAHDDLPCPYRGQFHFGPDDAALFFGRDAVVERLHQAIQTRAFLPLLGASGSGKSSVVLAGPVPLYAPRLNATERMAQVRQNFPTDRVLLIVDHFEELYTPGADDPLRRVFLDALLAGFPGDRRDARTTAAHQARLVLTMRADERGGNAGGDREARREGQTITHGAYTAIGGVEGALARHADASYAALSLAQKEEARRVFLQLVRPGEGTEDTRRVAFGGPDAGLGPARAGPAPARRGPGRHRQAHGGQAAPPMLCSRAWLPQGSAVTASFRQPLPPASSGQRSADRRMGAQSGTQSPSGPPGRGVVGGVQRRWEPDRERRG